MVSIYLIRRAIYSPYCIFLRQHYFILTDIANLILAKVAAGYKVELLKVKSHTGVLGNDMADKLANTARLHATPADYTIEIPKSRYGELYWLQYTYTNARGFRVQRYVPNLHSGLTELCHRTSDVGQTNTDSVYYNVWTELSPDLHPVSHSFLTKPVVTDPVSRSALRLRTGTLYNNKLAARYNSDTSHTPASCPLCHGPDSGSHIAGGCRHRNIKKLVIARHNAVGLLVARSVQKGAIGNDLLVADLCSHSDLAPKLSGVKHSRIPAWVLPRVPGVKLAKLRPDMLLVRHHKSALHPKAKKTGAYIVEIKVTSDTSPNRTARNAEVQHRSLLRKFIRHKWKKVKLLPLVFGASGTIPKTTVDHLRTLGVTGDSLSLLLSKVHKQLLTSLHSMVVERRRLEATTSNTP